MLFNAIIAQSDVMKNLGKTGGAAQLTTAPDFEVVIGRIIQGLLGFLGVVFLVLIMYGGFMWMTAGGNEEKISKAKKIIGNSVIGLLIVIVSYALTLFIFDVIIKATL